METYVVVNPAVVKKLKAKVESCKITCATSYEKLKKPQQQHIDDLINTVFVLYAYAKPHLPALLHRVKKLDANAVQVLLDHASTFISGKEVKNLISTFLEVYGDGLKDKKRLRAYGDYLTCLLANVDPQVKELLNTAFHFAHTIVKLFEDTNMKKHIKEVAVTINSEVLKPVHRALKKSKKQK